MRSWTGFPIHPEDEEIVDIVPKLAEQVVTNYGLGRLEVLLRQALDGSESIARQLQELAWQRLHVGPWHETWMGWRHLYALSTCAVVNVLLNDVIDERLRECLREIDLALLMGGELCRTRLQKCASEISHDLSERMSFPSSLLVVGASLPLPLPTSGGTCVERVSRLDILRFGREFFSQHRPVVITDSMEHWAAVSDPDRKWNQISYLKRRCAFRTVPIELGSQYTAEKWSQKLMTIGEFIDNHVVASASTSKETGYLAQHDLLDQIPELQNDVATPDLVCVGADDESVRSNVWFGPAGTVSPLHTDPDENLLCQVVGSKYIRLYAAEHTDALYPAPGLMSNTSQVDCLDVDEVTFPKFSSIPFFECELQQGEMLYIPAKMWHFVKSLSPSVSVNFWFR